MFRQHQNLEERLLLLARTRGHSPAAERAVERFSRLGEHGALWLAIGYAGGLTERSRRREWARARRAVLATYALNTTIKFIVRRRRPVLAGLPPLTGTTTGLSFPSAHAATSFAGAFAYHRRGLPAGPLYGAGRGDGLLAGLPRRALPLGHPRGCSLGDRAGGRDRWAAGGPRAG